MGTAARRILQTELPLQESGGKAFKGPFLREHHQVIAKHGHEWDPQNRYDMGGAAIGDAIVIELLVRLPVLIARGLDLAERDPSLDFLYELDSIRPQSPRIMAEWIVNGIGGLQNTSKVQQVIQESFEAVAHELASLKDRVVFETFTTAGWWINFLSSAAPTFAKWIQLLTTALKMPVSESASPYGDFALSTLQVALANGGDYRYLVCGHTHLPELVVLDAGKTSPSKQASVYFNTGTWRRVHRAASLIAEVGSSRFAGWNEGCVVCIYSPEDQAKGSPPYEFHRGRTHY